MNKNRLTVFTVEFIAMAIEICMSYILSPYFGNSNVVWTGVVSVILLSNSIGNWIGGTFKQKRTGSMLLLAGMLLSISLYAAPLLCYWLCRLPIDITASAIIAAVILLLPCEICLGTIPSQAMCDETEFTHEGKRIGIIYALSTIGGVLGSILSGFVLIPFCGADITLTVCIGLLLISGGSALAFGDIGRQKKSGRLFISLIETILAVGMLGAYFFGNLTEVTEMGFVGEGIFYLTVDSEYNRIQVYDGYKGADPIRIMKIGTGLESASYTAESKRYDMVFDYCQAGAAITERIGKANARMLIIGGGAYQIPKYYLAHTNYDIEVIEIDSKITEIAEQFFYLNDCITQYDADGTRFTNRNMDAKVMLNTNCQSYDYILNDAFSGLEPVRTLTTLETVRQVKDALKDDGIYMVNIIASKTGERSEFLKAEANTIAQAFTFVYVIHVDQENIVGNETVTNHWILASDKELPFENQYDFSEGFIITDKYCPIESLLR